MKTTLKKGQGYTEDFKQSIINLYRNGKSSGEIMSEYGISSSSFYKWLKKYSVVQLSETESMTMVEIKAMQKRLALLEEENLILKKTISIFTRE
jgi:transposase